MKKSFIILVMTLCTAFGAAAQTSPSLRTGYFQDRMYMRHTLNPALVNEFNYLALPVLGGVGIGANTNLGLNDFLFPDKSNPTGELKTFLHPDITSKEFSKRLNKLNTVSESATIDIFALGFYGFGGFNTLGISLREDAQITIPRDLFMLVKGGQSEYDLSNMGVTADAYVEVAFGHARKVTEKITVGAKLKGLVGLGYADFHTDNTVLTMSEDLWKVSANGKGEVAALGMDIDLDDEGNLSYEMGAIPMPGGIGGAIDLGVTYDLTKNASFSLAVTDLGFITWTNVSNVSIKGGEVTLVDYNDPLGSNIDSLSQSLENKLDDIMEKAQDIASVGDVKTGHIKNRTLSPTLRAGAEYAVFNDRISFGILGTYKFGKAPFREVMGVLDLNLLKCFEMSFSGSLSNMGTYWGALINFCPRSFLNFYLGTDCMISKVTPQLVPIDAVNVNCRLGMAIPLGGRKSHLDKHFNK